MQLQLFDAIIQVAIGVRCKVMCLFVRYQHRLGDSLAERFFEKYFSVREVRES